MATEVARSYTSWLLSLGPHEDISVPTKVHSRAELHHCIFALAEHICNHPDNIASATQSVLLHAENCIATGGGHLEQVL